MFVIMTEDRKCIVKGKSRKYLCGVEEKTLKELVSYSSRQNAKSAMMRFYLLQSDYAGALYGGRTPRLEIVELD